MTDVDRRTSPSHGFHPADYVIFVGVLAISLAIGLYHAFTGGKQRTTKEFLMANRQMKTLPVALSMLVSFVSGILVLGNPAEMYTRGTQLFMRTIGYCLACLLSSLLFVPLFFSLKVTSSFEYLERRYHSKVVKLMGTVSMLIGNLFYMGLVIYAPATALEAVTKFNMWISVVASGVITTVYTALGGLKAVIWTDVFQAVVMVTGMLIVVIKGIINVGGLDRVWSINNDGGRIIFFDFNPDPTQRLSFWSTVIGGMVSTLGIFGIGQASVQRFCTLPTLAQAKRAVYLNIPFLVIINILSLLVGLVIYAHYADIGCDPLKSKAINNANQLVPYYIVNVLNFPGLPGAFLAVLFSGALSSLSSSLNSAAAVTWQDIIRYFFKDTSEQRQALITKFLVVIYGMLAIAMAFAARMMGEHVLWASLSFTGATMGPTLGIFLLGALVPFANATGAIVGCVIASAFSLWISVGAFIVKPHRVTLPTSVEGCAANLNGTFGIHGYGSFFNESYIDLRNSSSEEHFTTSKESVSDLYSSLEHGSKFDLIKLYEISFLWYCTIGCVLAMMIGTVVSYLTKSKESKETDPRLLIPLFYQLACCLPGNMRQTFLQKDIMIESPLTDNTSLDKQKMVWQYEEEQSSVVCASKTMNESLSNKEDRNSCDSVATAVTMSGVL